MINLCSIVNPVGIEKTKGNKHDLHKSTASGSHEAPLLKHPRWDMSFL